MAYGYIYIYYIKYKYLVFAIKKLLFFIYNKSYVVFEGIPFKKVIIYIK